MYQHYKLETVSGTRIWVGIVGLAVHVHSQTVPIYVNPNLPLIHRQKASGSFKGMSLNLMFIWL